MDAKDLTVARRFGDRTRMAVLAVLKEMRLGDAVVIGMSGENAEAVLCRLAGAIAQALGNRALLAATAEAVERLKYRARFAQTLKERDRDAAAWRVLDWNVKSALGERSECWACPDQNRAEKLAAAVGSRYCPDCLPRELADWKRHHSCIEAGATDLGHGPDCDLCVEARFNEVAR